MIVAFHLNTNINLIVQTFKLPVLRKSQDVRESNFNEIVLLKSQDVREVCFNEVFLLKSQDVSVCLVKFS